MWIITNDFEKRFVSPLAKVSDWNLFRVNQNYSDSFWYLYPSQSESFRTNPKNVLFLPWQKYRIEIHSESIRIIPIFVSEPMRIIPNQSEKRFISPLAKVSDWNSFRVNQNYCDICIRANANHFEPIRKTFCFSLGESIGLKFIPISVSEPMRIIPN